MKKSFVFIISCYKTQNNFVLPDDFESNNAVAAELD